MRISARAPLTQLVPATIALALVAALLCLVPGGADARPAQKVAQKVRHAERLLEISRGVDRFSPNGDGLFDRAGPIYRLKHPARVKVEVRNAHGTVVRTANLGKRPAGRRWHEWSWYGRNDRGTYVRDGAYRLTFTATAVVRGKRLRDSDTARAVTQTRFDLKPNGNVFVPDIYVDRDAIYRDTTYFKDEFHWSGSEYIITNDGSPASTGVSRITGPDGEVVFDDHRDPFFGRGYNTWDGTDEHGDRVPAGTYRLVNTWTDRYGNNLSVTKPLVVGDGSRVEQHHSVTVTPADVRVGTATEPYEVLTGGRLNPHLTYACPPRASDRFPAGALSFSLYDPRCTISSDSFTVASPYQLNLLFDTVKVTAVGGPTTAGGEGAATFGISGPAGTSVQTLAGDEASTVTQTQRLTWRAFADDVTWTLSRQSGGYDVKTFTIDIYHYAPPA